MTIRDLIDAGKITLDTVVLGELPMTADKCIVGCGADLYSIDGGGGPMHDGSSKLYVQDNSSWPDAHWYLGVWYSTRAAAEAALACHEHAKGIRT